MYEVSAVFEAIENSKAKIVVLQGGTRSTKTYSACQWLVSDAIRKPSKISTIVGQDVPNLRKGPIRDIKNIIDSNPRFLASAKKFKEQVKEQPFINTSLLEFSSYESEQDAKSGARHNLFINEAQGISYEIFRQLYLRSSGKVIIDYNPDREFWVHEKILLAKQYDFELIISDHRQNAWITEEMHNSIEALKEEDLELWKVYARGKTGKLQGLVLPNFVEYKPRKGEGYNEHGIPVGAKFIGIGLDFGFTNDPTAAVGVWIEGKNLYAKEFIYETQLTTPMINERLEESGIKKNEEIDADSADPRLIRELQDYGWDIMGVSKEQILGGIDVLKRFKIHVIGINLLKEFNAYVWKKDRQTGKSLNVPIDKYNHGIDSIRYGTARKIIFNDEGTNYSERWS